MIFLVLTFIFEQIWAANVKKLNFILSFHFVNMALAGMMDQLVQHPVLWWLLISLLGSLGEEICNSFSTMVLV
jgi:hypothetical protein